jgi:hypothetical protein
LPEPVSLKKVEKPSSLAEGEPSMMRPSGCRVSRQCQQRVVCEGDLERKTHAQAV